MRFQLHRVISGVGAVQREEIDLADRAPVRTHLRHDAGRKRDLAEALEDALAVPVIVRIVVEDQLDIGEPEQRERTQVNHVRDAVHDDFQRDRDLLFDLFGGDSRPLRDDLDVIVGDIGIGFDGKSWKETIPQAKSSKAKASDQQTVVESEIDDAANHRYLFPVAPSHIAPPYFAAAGRWRRPDRRA